MTPETNLHLLRRDLADYAALKRVANRCRVERLTRYMARRAQPDARVLHLVGMFLRGKPYAEAEPRCNPFVPLDFTDMRRYLKRYGVQPYAWDTASKQRVRLPSEEYRARRLEEQERFTLWMRAAVDHREEQEEPWRAQQAWLHEAKREHAVSQWVYDPATERWHAPELGGNG